MHKRDYLMLIQCHNKARPELKKCKTFIYYWMPRENNTLIIKHATNGY